MVRVAVAGCGGRMGSSVVKALQTADDMDMVCGIDPQQKKQAFPLFTSVSDALSAESFEVLVDFTEPCAVANNVSCALRAGVNCVVGTTGLSLATLEELSSCAVGDACLFYAPNFTTGAVLMMQCAKACAPYFPEAEVIEFHHNQKKDAPSGTALHTAELIAQARGELKSGAPGRETEVPGAQGARGALIEGVPVHSVRSMGYVASQEVLFGSPGQTLTLRHDSWDRESYMPGVLLGIRSVIERKGLIVGLENFLH